MFFGGIDVNLFGTPMKREVQKQHISAIFGIVLHDVLYFVVCGCEKLTKQLT